MRYRLYATLAVAALLVTSACEGLENGDAATTATTRAPEPAATEEPPPAVEPDATPQPVIRTRTAVPTAPPPASPTPEAIPLPAGWRFAGSRQAGVQIGLPPDWINLASLLDEPDTKARFSDNLRFFAADQKRTGLTVVEGAPLAAGAVVLAFARQSSSRDPEAELSALLTAQNVPTDTLQTATVNRQAMAYIDLDTDPLGLLNAAAEGHRQRLLLTPLNEGEQMLFLFAAPAVAPVDAAALFDTLMETILLFVPPGTGLPAGGGNGSALPIESGTRRSATVRAGQTNVYSFTARADQLLTAVAAPQDGGDLTLTLIGPAGRILAASDRGFDGDAELFTDVPLPLTGTYFLRVTEFFGQSSDYTLSLQVTDAPLFGGGGILAPGQEVDGSLRANESHEWSFSGVAGQVFSVVLTPDSEQLDVVLRLYGPDGERLLNLDEGFSGDAEVIAGYELSISGEYRIEVKDFSGRGGPYRLALDDGDSGLANFYEAGDLLSGAIVEETLQEREAHAWFIDGFAGDQVNIVAAPLADNLDLKIWLLTPRLERLVIKDDTLAGEIENITLTLPENGQYVLLVQEFEGTPGAYRISYVVVGNELLEIGGALANGEVVDDTLPVGKSTLWYFDGYEDATVTISATPTDDDTDLVLVLRAPNGAAIITVDAAGPGEAELLEEYILAGDGEWSVLVGEFLDNGGGYTLSVLVEEE